MGLPAHRIRLPQPRTELPVDLGDPRQAERVHVIARRDRLNLSKPWMRDAPRQHDVPVQPPSPRRHLRKRHPDLKGDARLLRQDADRPNGSTRGDDGVVERANSGILSDEMFGDPMAAAAGMRLIPIRKEPRALRAAPERPEARQDEASHRAIS